MPNKNKKIEKNKKPLSFQDIIMNLQKFWGKYGCVILQPYDIEVGAGTFHPATTLRSLGSKPWKLLSVSSDNQTVTKKYKTNLSKKFVRNRYRCQKSRH